MPISGPVMIDIRDLLDRHFTESDLESICTFLNIQYENLAGKTKASKALNLVDYLSRRSRVAELATAVAALFPDVNVDWPPEVVPRTTLTGTASQGTRLSHVELQKIIPILAGRPMFITPDGRLALLTVAGVVDYINPNLNGDSQFVAYGVVTQLSKYGEITPGETALGRLLRYLTSDGTLPPTEKNVLEEIINVYHL